MTAGLDFLLGQWSIERIIDDFRSSRQLHFTGMVSVMERETPRTASYVESGLLRTTAGTSPARRALGLLDRENGVVIVTFEDGRSFFDLDLRGGHSQATHHCGSDAYEIVTTAESADRLTESWRVRGPLKDYRASTVMTRRRPTTGGP